MDTTYKKEILFELKRNDIFRKLQPSNDAEYRKMEDEENKLFNKMYPNEKEEPVKKTVKKEELSDRIKKNNTEILKRLNKVNERKVKGNLQNEQEEEALYMYVKRNAPKSKVLKIENSPVVKDNRKFYIKGPKRFIFSKSVDKKTIDFIEKNKKEPVKKPAPKKDKEELKLYSVPKLSNREDNPALVNFKGKIKKNEDLEENANYWLNIMENKKLSVNMNENIKNNKWIGTNDWAHHQSIIDYLVGVILQTYKLDNKLNKKINDIKNKQSMEYIKKRVKDRYSNYCLNQMKDAEKLIKEKNKYKMNDNTKKELKRLEKRIIELKKECKKSDDLFNELFKPAPKTKKEPVKKPIQKLKDLIENYKNEIRTKFNLQETTMAKLGNEKINKKYQEFSILNEELRNKLTENIKKNEFKDIPAKTQLKNVKDFIKFLDGYNEDLFEEITKPAPNIEHPKKKESGKLYTFQEYLDKKNNDFNDKIKEQEKQQPKEIVKASKLNIKNYDVFYKKLFETLSNRSKRNINSFIKSYPDFKDNINTILDSQTFLDFYPTPMHCLEPTKDIVKTADKILEPTAGLGAITYWLDKYISGDKITAVELEPTMAKILNQLQPKLNVLVGNFLNKPLNSFSGIDTIYCNPPFTLGNDKRFYYDFLFKCLAILNTNGRGRLIFISPSLVEDPIKDSYIDEYALIKYRNLSPSKFDSIMKNYTPNPVSKAGFIKYMDTGEGQNAELFKLFKWSAGKVIMKCSGFGGTKIEAVVHQFVIL